MSKHDNYMVSVRLMTYNHEPFIAEAIQSVLDQKTNFNVELVIGDDFSSDKTLDIAKSFESTENVHIKILDRKKGDEYWQKRQKLGRLYNFVDIINNCNGKYIALLDGDDYWTDPLKLQKQVDFLEAHQDYTLCAHQVSVFYENSKSREWSKPNRKHNIDIDISTLVQRNPLFTASILIRAGVLKPLPFWFLKSPFGDYALYFIASMYGKMKSLKDDMAVYRKHKQALHSSLHNLQGSMIFVWRNHRSFYQIIDNNFFLKRDCRIKMYHRMILVEKNILKIYLKSMDLKAAFTSSFKILENYIFLGYLKASGRLIRFIK